MSNTKFLKILYKLVIVLGLIEFYITFKYKQYNLIVGGTSLIASGVFCHYITRKRKDKE